MSKKKKGENLESNIICTCTHSTRYIDSTPNKCKKCPLLHHG